VIPQASITAWRAVAPWADDAQVEQDLVLTRAVIELFAESAVASRIALRGGTSLNKLFMQPAVRYSEDIDLVQTKAVPIGPLLDAIRGKLDSWLGRPARSRAEGGVTLMYRFESEVPPVRPLRLKIEINTREHLTVLGFSRRRLTADNPWFAGSADVITYELDELLGTKLRALYQRRKGRDLFDLWLCIERGLVNPDRLLACFSQYMEHERHKVSRAQFEKNLHEKRNDAAFLNDIVPLLASGIDYDADGAMDVVLKTLIQRLPGEAWRGETTKPKVGERGRRRWGKS
jgi:predicted nucleotidyltransferase component of viral defense system